MIKFLWPTGRIFWAAFGFFLALTQTAISRNCPNEGESRSSGNNLLKKRTQFFPFTAGGSKEKNASHHIFQGLSDFCNWETKNFPSSPSLMPIELFSERKFMLSGPFSTFLMFNWQTYWHGELCLRLLRENDLKLNHLFLCPTEYMCWPCGCH